MNKKAAKAEKMKQKIISLLSKKTYGLSIDEISNSIGISRITASKYLAVMEAQGKVFVREIGNTKLHYLPKNIRGLMRHEKKQI